MLEIFFIVFLCKQMGAILRAKDRKPGLFQFLVVLLWFGGEIGGAIVFSVGTQLARADVPGAVTYLVAILTAVAAVGGLFLYARSLPVKSTAGGFPVGRVA
jgi:hypothetical protein